MGLALRAARTGRISESMRARRRCPGVATAVILLTSAAGPTCLAAPPTAGAGFSIVVTPANGIDASTWDTGSFQVTNTSTGPGTITHVRIDLRTAVLPDLVFDPVGAAGDLVAKCFTADAGAAVTGLVAPADPCITPFSGPHDGGYDVMDISFTGFGSGETFTFSVDVDPTTIKGATAPGPGGSGSISGLEMSGAGVEVTYGGGGVLDAWLLSAPGSDSGGQAAAPTAVSLPAPSLAALGVAATPATLSSAAQTIRVGGPAGAAVRLVRIEASLDTDGLAGGGFDVDPFEGNRAVAVAESAATLDASGIADIPVTLTRVGPDAGLNYFVAAFVDGSGRTGPVSEPLVLVPEDCTTPPPRSMTLTMTSGSVTWTTLPGATAYDLVRGDLGALRATHGDFAAATSACLANDLAATQRDDAALPLLGEGWFYLARGVSCGGSGTYDGSGFGQAGPRDAAINPSTGACP
jgi:hypothetical protein